MRIKNAGGMLRDAFGTDKPYTSGHEWAVPKAPLIGNRYLQAHWAVRHREMKFWRNRLRPGNIKPAHQGRKAEVVVRVTRKTRGRLQDPDNFATSLKPVFDALKHNGHIVDDSEKWCHRDILESKGNWNETFVAIAYAVIPRREES